MLYSIELFLVLLGFFDRKWYEEYRESIFMLRRGVLLIDINY